MSRWVLPSGRVIGDDTPFEIETTITVPEYELPGSPPTTVPEETYEDMVQYPQGVRVISSAQRTALGITEVTETEKPSDLLADVEEDPENPGEWIVTPFDLDRVKLTLLQYAKVLRQKKRDEGFMYGELDIPTDEESRTLLMGARIAADADPEWTTEYTLDLVTHTVTAAEIIALSDTVLAFVNNSFSLFKIAADEINAGTMLTHAEVRESFSLREDA